jgi:exodeoxyribonuclease VII small subunit
MTKKNKTPDFEQALHELEALVEKLESGDQPLEEALKHFERGVALTRECQLALKAAQAKVEILTRRSGVSTASGGDADDDSDVEPFDALDERGPGAE